MAHYSNATRWKKTIQGFTYALGKAGEHLTGWARDWMSEASQQALYEIDQDWPHGVILTKTGNKFGGSRYYPWYTGQLHDSVVGVVSDRHRIITINYMPKLAFTPQTYEGNSSIIGHDWALKEAVNVSRVLHFLPGIRSTLVVGVPYAKKVDEMPAHYGFIEELSSQYVSKVEDFFEIKAGGFRTRTYVAK